MLNLAFLVHNKRGPVGKLVLVIEDPVGLGNFALHVAKQWECHPDLLCECAVGGRCVNTDSENCRIVQIYFLVVDTSLVSLEFLRSTTCKRQHIKRENHIFLPAEIAEFYRFE